MKYISYRINEQGISIHSKSFLLSDSELKSLEHIAYDAYKLGSIAHPFIYKSSKQEFVFIRVLGDLLYLIITENNPYLYLTGEVVSINNEDIIIKPDKASLAKINNSLAEEDYSTLEMVVEAIIENIANNKSIYFSPKIPIAMLELVMFLIPASYLEYLDISYKYNTRIRISYECEKEPYFSFSYDKYNTLVGPKRYSYTIIDNLKTSIKSAAEYKKEIDRLIEKKKIDIGTICDLLNLIDGKIERINSIEKLAKAIKNLDGMKYNASYISTIVFTNINKYQITKDILYVYEFIYKNVASSHSYIIESFKNNIDKFISLDELNEEEYVAILDEIAPFPLVDYIYYLISKNELDSEISKSLNNDNYNYLLLDLICRWIVKDKLVLVPNRYLSYYLGEYINKDIDKLDLVVNRIKRLNSKALEALLNDEVIKLLRSNRSIEKIGLHRIFLIIQRLNILDTAHYVKKLSIIIDKYTFLDELLLINAADSNYYNRLLRELAKDKDGLKIIDALNERYLIKNQNIELSDLEGYYNKYYLNRHHNDRGSFINTIIDYLCSKDSISEAIEIYYRFYSRLDIHYKDTLTVIRKINDFIFNHYELIYNNPTEYIKALDEMNEALAKGRIEANSYYTMLKIGLELNNNYKILDSIIRYKTFLGYDRELKAFYDYFYDELLEAYIKYVQENLNIDNSLIESFRLVIEPFLEMDKANDRLISFIGNKENVIFYFLIISTNIDNKSYKRNMNKLLKALKRRELKKYLDDYISYLLTGSIDITIKDNTLFFIREYIENNMSKITKILLKLKHK